MQAIIYCREIECQHYQGFVLAATYSAAQSDCCIKVCGCFSQKEGGAKLAGVSVAL